MGRLLITPAWRRSVEHVALRMRHEDWLECRQAYGEYNDPKDVLRDSVARSDYKRCAMTTDGEPVAVFGVMSVNFLGPQGSVWMIATPALRRYVRESLTIARTLLPKLHADFGELVNYVYHENRTNLVWLSHLGFEIQPAAPYGVYKQPFHKVVRRVDECAMQHS